MLNVGDAVLTFLGDTSQLDQVFAKLPSQAAESMGAAAASVDQVGTAFEGVNFELDATASNVPYCGETIKTAMTEAGTNTRMAAGEVSLLGELFGIHLPRHVRTFIGELPGVGEALQAAFAATAVIFIIEALVKGVELLQTWADSSHQMQLAWDTFNTTVLNTLNGLDEKLLQAGIRMDELRGDHVDALRKELELINQQSMKELQAEFEKIAKAADEMFSKMSLSWLGIVADSTGAKNALKDFQTQYDLLLAEGKKTEAANLLTGTLKSAQDMKKAMDGAKASTDTWLEAFSNGLSGISLKLAETARLTDKQSGAQNVLVQALEAQEQAQKKIDDLAASDVRAKKEEAYLQALKDTEKVLTTNAATQKKIDAETEQEITKAREKAIAAFEETEKAKIAAAKAGSQARIAIIDEAIKEEESKGLQDTAFYRALQTDKVKAVQAAVDAEQKAITEAEAEQLKRADAAAKAELAQIANTYHEREEAVKQLASMQLISEQQKDRQLLSLYQQEETKTLAVLRDQVAKEKQIVDEAEKRAAAAGNNPLFSEAQLAALKKNLTAAEIAYQKTQTEITKTEEKFDKERMAIQKGAIGQAIALATAAGNQQLALDLKQHQSMLIAIQDQIALAKARGQDVSAMKEQEKEIANSTKSLEKQATQTDTLKQAWNIFSAEFQKGAKTDETAAQQMATSFETAASGMESAIQSAFAAMVSGSESAGKAIEKAVFSMISKIAEQWGAYFLAKAIADAVTPGMQATAAGELAAGAALEALGGVLGGLGSASSSSSGASSASTSTTAITPSTSTQAAGPGPSTPNVPRLFSGAIVTKPTYAMIGDREGGGSQAEGVFPLGDPRARQALMDALGSGGGDTNHNYYINGMISTTDLTRLTRVISRGANTGRVRMSVTNSNRVTRRT